MPQLHLQALVQRHSTIPYLWRSRCLCGAEFLAATEERARMALDNHISSEEPFPDLDLSNDNPEAKTS